jgi:CBS domain-containing protein
MESRKLVKASGGLTVGKAARLMAKKHVGAVLVVDDGVLAGIFTERDVLFRVVAQRLDPEKTLVREVMTPDPLTVAPKDSFGHALVLMREGGFRHLPVVQDGVPVGIVSSRSALDPDLEEFRVEESRRKHLVQQLRRN